LEAAKRVFSQDENEKSEQISTLTKRLDVENKVHEETTKFLERKYDELQQTTDYWDNKSERDIDEKNRQLEILKSKKLTHLAKLNELKQKYKEVHEMVMREKRLAEARAYAKDVQANKMQAATAIQTAFRKYHRRKLAKEKLKKLKRASFKANPGNPVGSSKEPSRMATAAKEPQKSRPGTTRKNPLVGSKDPTVRSVKSAEAPKRPDDTKTSKSLALSQKLETPNIQ
jgi:hypothetical protein